MFHGVNQGTTKILLQATETVWLLGLIEGVANMRVASKKSTGEAPEPVNKPVDLFKYLSLEYFKVFRVKNLHIVESISSGKLFFFRKQIFLLASW